MGGGEVGDTREEEVGEMWGEELRGGEWGEWGAMWGELRKSKGKLGGEI